MPAVLLMRAERRAGPRILHLAANANSAVRNANQAGGEDPILARSEPTDADREPSPRRKTLTVSVLRSIQSAAYALGGQHAAARARHLARDIRAFISEAGATANEVDGDDRVKAKIWQRTRRCSEKELLFLYAVDKEVAMLCESVARQHLQMDVL